MYYLYVGMVGFTVKQCTTRRFKDGELREQYYRCSADGKTNSRQPVTPSPQILGAAKRKRKRRRTIITRSDCKAHIRCKFNRKTGVYTIVGEEVMHNHELSRPEWQHLFRSERNISSQKAELIKSMESSGMKPTVGFRFLSQTACGKENVGH